MKMAGDVDTSDYLALAHDKLQGTDASWCMKNIRY